MAKLPPDANANANLKTAPMAKLSPDARMSPVPAKTVSKPPPPPQHHKTMPDDLEELSGSILLPDPSGGIDSSIIEELSGSILLPDGSGALPAVTEARAKEIVDPKRAALKQQAEELSGSFLLDAGSTGALPALDSASAIRAASADDLTQPVERAPAP